MSRAGTVINLAAKELQLLRHLIDHRGQVLSRERLLARVWHQSFIGPRTVDVHIAWLRQKLENNPQSPRSSLQFVGKATLSNRNRSRTVVIARNSFAV